MRKYVWLPLLLLAVFGSAAVESRAQVNVGLRAKVPFDFIVGEKTFSAGTISTRGVTASEAGSVSIRNLNNNEQASRVAHRLTATDTAKHGKLVFHKYGDRYYLAEIWVPGYKAWKVEKSKSERTVEREARLAQNTKLEVVSVIAD
jgi:hypothetical protein